MIQGGCGKCCIAAACTAPNNTLSTPVSMLECYCLMAKSFQAVFRPVHALAAAVAEAYRTACDCDLLHHHAVRCLHQLQHHHWASPLGSDSSWLLAHLPTVNSINAITADRTHVSHLFTVAFKLRAAQAGIRTDTPTPDTAWPTAPFCANTAKACGRAGRPDKHCAGYSCNGDEYCTGWPAHQGDLRELPVQLIRAS